MGLGGISVFQLTIVLLICLLVFGTKKMRNIGEDLGSAVKGFKRAMKDDKSVNPTSQLENNKDKTV